MMSFKVGELHPNTPHLFADLAELLVIVKHFGREFIHSNDLEGLFSSSDINSDEIDEEFEADGVDVGTASKNSRTDLQVEEVLAQLEYRAKAFSEYYPFELEGQALKFKPRQTNAQRVYVFLVCASRMRSFVDASIYQSWAKVFVNIARFAMIELSPMSSITRVFDANSTDRKNYYGSDFRDALRTLGADLSVINIVEAECQRASSSGDGGLDLISILHFDDGAVTHPALFGQCGAQETQWPKKTLEAHPLNFKSYFNIQVDHPSVMFTPVCYRSTTGEWVNNRCTNAVWVVDRLRIMRLIGLRDGFRQIVWQSWFTHFENDIKKFIKY